MAIVISRILLSKFMDCPVEGAHPVGPRDPPVFIDPPVNAGLPVITGDMTVGSVLMTTDGVWISTEPLTYTYQWKSNGVDVVASTTRFYVVAPGDVGATISVTVTAHNVGGSTAVTVVAGAGQDGTGPPTPVGGLLNSYLPTISGTLTIGSTLTTTDGGWVGTPPPTFTYSWQRDDVDIPGATSKTYLIVQADGGHLITSTVTATNSFDTLQASSGAVGPIALAVINDVLPTISGSIVVGSTLTVNKGTWEGSPAPTFAYQWRRNGINIGGATSTNYSLGIADIDMIMDCVVTGTNASGSVSAISNSLGPVVAAATIALSNSYVAKGAAIGSTVGILSVTNGSGTYTYTLTSNPGSLYSISGSNLNVAGPIVSGSVTIRVNAAGGSPVPAQANFLITVTTLSLSVNTIPANAPLGTTIGSFSVGGGSGSFTYALTSNPTNQFSISGANLIVANPLSVGTYPISVKATGGSPPLISDNFTIVIRAGVTWDRTTTANVTLSGGDLIATNTGTTSNDQGARV